VEPLLRLHHVSKSFGSVTVADRVTFQLETGEALGVVGPNGAGKTTLMNLIAGTLPVDGGFIEFDGVDITDFPPDVRCRSGIARTYQIPEPFEGLTVFENVLVGIRFGRRDPDPDPPGTAMALLERVDLAAKANVLAGSLTLLERKRLELARAMGTDPRLLLLDEVASGLVEAEIEQLVGSIAQLRAQGLTIIWIEHIAVALLSVVDRMLAIDFGRVLKEGPPHEVMASPEVRAVYMGVEE
jgi:branched-chain amino acid transport system ATP-binding protein